MQFNRMTHGAQKAILAALLISSSTLYAAEDNIEEILVTTKTRQSLSDVLATSYIFTQEDIEAAQVNDVPALLDLISGISVIDTGGRGSSTSLFLRGASLSQLIVLIDGVRVGSASLGSATLNAYPIEAIERIEVVKGPLSGVYGADAVGGVIQLFTKKGGSDRGDISVSLGSESLTEIGAGINLGNEQYSVRISAQTEELDGIDRTSITTGGNDDKDGFKEDAFSIAGRAQFNENTTANLSVLYADNNSEFDNTFGDDTGFFTDTTTLNTALNVSTQINDRYQWNTILGLNSDEAITPAFSSEFKTQRDSLGTELAITLDTNNSLTIGVDYYQEDLDTAADFPVTERDNTGVFALLQSNRGAFGFVGSLRYDDNSAYGSDTNVSAAVNYDFNDNIRSVLSYGTAFVAPSFNRLYFPFFGNPDLLPEESKSLEFSLQGDTNLFSWRASAFETDVKNLFSIDPGTFLAANIGESELKGLEFELNTTLREWTLGLNLDLQSAKNLITDVELDDRAEKTLALTAARNFGAWDLGFKLKTEGGRFDNSGTELSGYGLFDVNAQYEINRNFTLLANIDNFFDKNYTLNLIGPTQRYNTLGRQFKLTLKYNF